MRQDLLEINAFWKTNLRINIQRKEQNIRLYPLLRAVRVFTRVDGGGIQLGLRLSHFDAAIPCARPCVCLAV